MDNQDSQTVQKNFGNQSIFEKDFFYEEISPEIEKRILGTSYPANCGIPLEDLRYVKVKHYDFNGNVKDGELIVNASVAGELIDILVELYEHKYPIAKMVLIDEYGADDEKSMEDNNTSCFNYRNIDSSERLSLHSYGLAIDINPLYNPYVRTGFGERNVLPANASIYVDRNSSLQGMIIKDDICYNAFISRGWKWGGEWSAYKDYQHFYK